MLATTTAPSKYEAMAEALFIDFRGARLTESDVRGLEEVHLSKAIVVNGDNYIPENTTLYIDRPAGSNLG